MAIEMYRVVDTYLIYVDQENGTDEPITLKAVVLEMDGFERLFIRYSHTMIPSEKAAGPWYSNSMTKADSREHAKAVIEQFANEMERSFKIVPWMKDL